MLVEQRNGRHVQADLQRRHVRQGLQVSSRTRAARRGRCSHLAKVSANGSAPGPLFAMVSNRYSMETVFLGSRPEYQHRRCPSPPRPHSKNMDGRPYH